MSWSKILIELVFLGSAALLFLSAYGLEKLRRWRLGQEQLMQEVTELTSHVAALQNNCPQAIVQFERSGRIRVFNPAAERLFGYDADELLGENIVKLIPGALTSGRATTSLEVKRKDGTVLQVPFHAAKPDADPFSSIYLFLDRSAKGNMAVSSALSYAARMVGRISGRYETLLTTINGYSELAFATTAEDDPLRQELQEIMNASHQASSLTRHLAAFSGRQYLAVEPVDLSLLVRGMLARLREAVPFPIDFDVQPTDQASMINADWLRELILLLCSAASRRMRAADRLRVRTRSCQLSEPRTVLTGELSPGGYGVLTVADTGRPLSEQFRDHLFEPLYRIHEEIGVDLSPVYGMVRSLGGGIDVITGDTGTTFEILLPGVIVPPPKPLA